jgi:hypothetical protein
MWSQKYRPVTSGIYFVFALSRRGTKIVTSEDLNQRRVTIQPTDGPDGLVLLSDDR